MYGLEVIKYLIYKALMLKEEIVFKIGYHLMNIVNT